MKIVHFLKLFQMTQRVDLYAESFGHAASLDFKPDIVKDHFWKHTLHTGRKLWWPHRIHGKSNRKSIVYDSLILKLKNPDISTPSPAWQQQKRA